MRRVSGFALQTRGLQFATVQLTLNGGESGIRTRGTPLKGVQSLSRRSLSATQPSLRLPVKACIFKTRRPIIQDVSQNYLAEGEGFARHAPGFGLCPPNPRSFYEPRVVFWRREQDSNPRTFRSTVFKTAAFDHSAIPPDTLQFY